MDYHPEEFYRYRRRPSPSRLPAFFLIVGAILFVGTGVLAYRHLSLFRSLPLIESDPRAAPRMVESRGDLWPEEQRIADLYENAKKSAVAVYTLRGNRVVGSGSGFVWDANGRIVTNAHVVAGGTRFEVTFADQTTVPAELIAAYPQKDTAVLQLRNLPGSKLQPIPLGRSADLKVGQYTFAIGGPYGLEQTLTRGIVSALGREIDLQHSEPIKGAIQTDAAINPGNSGGPLLDSAGRLIGMNTAILSKSGASAGIGFAIPVDEVNQIVTQLIRYGRVLDTVSNAA